MTKALRVLLGATLGVAFFMFVPLFSHAQSGGVIIFEQLDSSSDAQTNTTISEIVATSSTGFAGFSPAYLHIILNPVSSTRTFEGNPSGVGSLRFYYNTACSGSNLNFAISDTVIPSASGFDDYYLDLTNPMAVATSGVQCIAVKNIATLGNSRIKTNAGHTLAFSEMGATFAAFPIGSFNTLVGTPTTTSIFGSAATTTGACDTIQNGFAWGLCSAGAYLFVPEPTILNQYANFPNVIAEKFPFSVFYDISDAFGGLAATTSSSTPKLTIPYATIAIGTSSPLGLSNIVGNTDVFSTTTITQYIGSSNWAIFMTLISAAIWLALGANIYFTVRDRMTHV